MSKQSAEQTAVTPRREREKTVKGRIPDVEWLFGYGETKKAQGDKFLTKLLRRDWLMVVYSTLIYLLQCAPVWVSTR